jgi:uracil phosphoribosyltransferase
MLFVIGEQSSLANQFLSELRDQLVQQDRARFRNNLQRLGEIMAYEVSKKLPMVDQVVLTQLGKTTMKVMERQPVLITIMRAGLPYFAGFQNFFENAECGFVGAYRKENEQTLTIQLDYLATPSLEGKEVILVDPMLATGRSVMDALKELIKRGTPKHVHLASVVAAPEGIRHLEENSTLPFSIWTFAVDEKLNHQYYIVPGLGDAGDLSFGSKEGK